MPFPTQNDDLMEDVPQDLENENSMKGPRKEGKNCNSPKESEHLHHASKRTFAQEIALLASEFLIESSAKRSKKVVDPKVDAQHSEKNHTSSSLVKIDGQIGLQDKDEEGDKVATGNPRLLSLDSENSSPKKKKRTDLLNTFQHGMPEKQAQALRRRTEALLKEQSISFKALLELEVTMERYIEEKQQEILDAAMKRRGLYYGALGSAHPANYKGSNQFGMGRRTLATSVTRVFRLYLTSMFHEKDVEVFGGETKKQMWWILRLHGHLQPRENKTGDPPSSPPQGPSFSQLFKKCIINLDATLYPGMASQIEWTSKETDPSVDGLQLSRPGSRSSKVRIILCPNTFPEKFRLSMPLALLLGVQTESMEGIMGLMWTYIKENHLQCVDDPSIIVVDEKMKTLFIPTSVPKSINLSTMHAVLKAHVSPTDSFLFEFYLQAPEKTKSNFTQACFDIQLDIEDASLYPSLDSLNNMLKSPEIEDLDREYQECLERITVHKANMDFFEGFADNPVHFINDLVLSQSRDLKVMSGVTGRNPEEERRSQFYYQNWVHEAVPRYVMRKELSTINEKGGDS